MKIRKAQLSALPSCSSADLTSAPGSSATGASGAQPPQVFRPLSFQEAWKYVESLDVDARGKVMVLWSGFSQGNRQQAEAFAARLSSQGRAATTLEMTPGGEALESADLSALSDIERVRLWRRLSERFVQGAKGDVYVFSADVPDRAVASANPVIDGDYQLEFQEPDRIVAAFATVERRILDELKSTGVVTGIFHERFSGSLAARQTDMHTCPLVTPGTPAVPHVGGPVTGPCVPTVLIGGLPAAVAGDVCTCVGPPDAIAKGSTTVMIGGRPAARVGDATVHGGVITTGCPTVIIGG